MKVFVSIDLEGCSGVFAEAQIEPGRDEYEGARRHMQRDLMAVVDGCLAAGAEAIVVCDAHDRGANLAWPGMPDAVTLVAGSPDPAGMMAGLDDTFDACLFVGYHAMAGTRGAVLDHTLTYKVFRVRVDDAIEVGELGLNAGVAGAFGVPVVFVSGDDKTALEARELLPGIETVVVKDGVTRTAARLRPPQAAAAALRAGAERALRAPRSAWPAPPSFDEMPLRVVLTRSDFADAAAGTPGVERVDGRTIRIETPTYLEAYRALVAALRLAAQVGPS